MRDAIGQRLPVKSKLLAGAAGMTAMVMSTAAFAADAAPPADTSAAPPVPAAPVSAPAATPAQAMAPIDPPKWLPYVDIGGGVGSGFAIGRANAFVPVWQDLDSLAFVRFGAATDTRGNSANDFNIGAGYRTKLDDEWILGAFAGFDSTQTNYNHTFNQFSFGLEAMSADWDVRANAYLAKNTNRTISNKFELYIHDTTIAILQGQEAAMSGFDGEVGYRVFNTDSTDVRVFAGAYTFHHSDVDTAGVGTNFSFPYHDITGPKLRAEVNVFDLDMLGSQSRFSIEGQVSHDSVNHTSEYIGATLRIALNDPSGSGAQTLDDLDRRMADPVRRSDNVLTQWNFNKPEPVIIYNSTLTSKPTNTLFYAEQRSGAATGSYADQTTIQDATSRGGAGKNAFIVLTDAGGSAIDATGTTVKSGETLTGAGTFKVRGKNSAIPVFTHDFAPGSGPVSLGTTSGNVLNVAGNANIANLSIVGPFVDGIHGVDVGNVTISNVTIDGGGTGTNGIVFNQTDTSGTSNIVIKNSSITGVTNNGVALIVSETGGSTSTTNLIGSNLTINAGINGVSLTSTVGGVSDATVYAGIHSSSIAGGTTGVKQNGTVAGGTLNQNVVVDPTAITGGHYGVSILGSAASGGSLTQSFVDTDGSIHGSFEVYATSAGGSVTQNVQAANITVRASGELSVGAYTKGGSITQTVSLSNVTANGNAHNGINVFANGYNASTINQTVSLSRVEANDAGYNGVYVEADASYGATVLQTVTLNDLAADNNAGNGVRAFVGGYSKTSQNPSVAAQYLTINGATLTRNTYDGVSATAAANGNAVVRQDVNVLGAAIQGNAVGIEIDGSALNGASVQQNIYFANDIVTHNTFDGIDLRVTAHGGNGFAAQYGSIYDVYASYNGHDGVFISAAADAADAEQQFYMVGVTADHERRDGVEVQANATGYTTGSYTTYPAHVEQDLYVIYSNLSFNERDGLEISDHADNRAQIDQSAFVYGSHLDDNAHYGFRLQAYADGPASATYANGEKTSVNSNIYIEASEAIFNVHSGVYIYTAATGAAVLNEHLTVEGSNLSDNGNNGLVDVAYATGYLSENIHYVTLAGSKFDHNVEGGAVLIAAQYAGPGPYGVSIQFDTISDSDFSNNRDDGLLFGMYATGYNGRAEVYATISGSNFSHNGRNGIAAFAYAGEGGYVAGYDCSTIQGTVGYCAVVRESISVDSSTITDNAHSGIYMGALAEGYGAIYAHSGRSFVPSLYVSNSTISGNAYAGISLFNEGKYYSYQSQVVVIDNTKITGNGTDGKYFDAGPGLELLQGGIAAGNDTAKYSVGQQFIFVQDGSDISANKGFGISIVSEGFGALGINNVLAVYDSSVSGNYGGALMLTLSEETFGNVSQVFYSYHSHFDNNVGGPSLGPFKYSGSGVEQTLFAYGVLGAAYQYFGSVGSTFSGNDRSGAEVDSLVKYAGVQTQTVVSSGDTFSSNSDYGLAVALSSKYNQGHYNTQNISVTGDVIDHNGSTGLYNIVFAKYRAGTYLTQTVSVADTALDNNGGDGFDNLSYVDDGSFLQQSIKFYSYHGTSSASGNSGYGVYIRGNVPDGALISYNHVDGVTISGNGDAGLAVDSYAASGSLLAAKYYINGNTITGNLDGIGLNSRGPDSNQQNYLTNNTVTNNSAFGVIGYAGNGGFQYVQVYTGGNTVTGNSPNYSFSSGGGGTQTHD